FELQRVPEERLNLFLDPLGQAPRAGDADDPVVCIPDVLDPDEVGIAWVSRRERSHLLREVSNLLRHGPAGPRQRPLPAAVDQAVSGVPPADSAPLVLLPQPLDEQVEFVEVDVGEDRAAHAPLWGSDKRAPPFLPPQVARPEGFPDQAEESLVRDPLSQQGDQDVVVDLVEAGLDVALDDPGDTGPLGSELT